MLFGEIVSFRSPLHPKTGCTGKNVACKKEAIFVEGLS
jgi:hypothetical protein